MNSRNANKPSPSSPIRFSGGTRTSSHTNEPVTPSSIMVRFTGPRRKPGQAASTMNPVRLRAPAPGSVAA